MYYEVFFMRISVDFDGVIADASAFKVKLAKKKFDLTLRPEQTTGAFMRRLISNEEYDEFRREVNGIYTLQTKIVPGCKKALGLLMIEGHKIIILTARFAHEQGFAKKFLEVNNIPYNHFLFVAEGKKRTKKEVINKLKIGAMIDDYYDNLTNLSGSGIGIYLFDQPWNRKNKIDKSDIIRVFGWTDVLDRIRALSAEKVELVR